MTTAVAVAMTLTAPATVPVHTFHGNLIYIICFASLPFLLPIIVVLPLDLMLICTPFHHICIPITIIISLPYHHGPSFHAYG